MVELLPRREEFVYQQVSIPALGFPEIVLFVEEHQQIAGEFTRIAIEVTVFYVLAGNPERLALFWNRIIVKINQKGVTHNAIPPQYLLDHPRLGAQCAAKRRRSPVLIE